MPILDLPEYFTWATQANRTQTPASAGITASFGHDYSQRPAPRMMNYIHNIQGRWAQRAVATAAGTWTGLTDQVAGSGVDLRGIVRNDTNGYWIIVDSTGQSYRSYDGVSWETVGSTSVAPVTFCRMINNTTDGVLVGTATTIEYTQSASAWSSTGTAAAVLANKGVNDFFLSSTGSTLSRWLTGIGGGATAPSSTSWGGTAIADITGRGDSTTNWALAEAAASGSIHLSSDDGDNWTAAPADPASVIAGFQTIALGYDDGTLVAVGFTGATPRIAYSTDESTTWTAANYEPFYPTTSSAFLRVLPLGNKCWIAAEASGPLIPVARTSRCLSLWISIDDAANWYPVSMTYDNSGITNNVLIYNMWCDGTTVMAVGTEEVLARSGSIGAEY